MIYREDSLVVAALGAAVLAGALSGCGGGDGGGSGSATIEGNVASSTAAVERAEGSWLARLGEIASGIGRAFAQGSIGGIGVTARRGDRSVSDVTDENGEFDLPGSPTGDVALSFERGDCRAEAEIVDVTRGSTLRLRDVALDCDAASFGKVEEVFQGIVRNKPSSPNGNLNVCVSSGGQLRTRIVKLQNATFEGGSFESLREGDRIEAEGEREGLGSPSALDAEVVRILASGEPGECEALLTPTPTPEATPTPTPTP